MSFKENYLRIEVASFFDSCLDFISLTKPKILSLLLISTICPMILSSHGKANVADIFFAVLGGCLVSGSASAFNCILESDIDSKMERTKNRPMPQTRITNETALLFAFLLGFLGIFVFTVFLNPIAASIALFGHFFYVFVYTVLLKRNTPQNIVIGGAAGAIPPLVGWAAVTGGIDLTAILLFMVVFLWTPPHFWALALNKNEDYKRANIPMLPVVAGKKATHRQMLIYALLLIPVSVLLVLVNADLGAFSMCVLFGLSLVFAYKTYELGLLEDPTQAEAHSKKAWDVFGFSLIYLALFFATLVIDCTIF